MPNIPFSALSAWRGRGSPGPRPSVVTGEGTLVPTMSPRPVARLIGMTSIEFPATVLRGGKTATGIRVPVQVVDLLGAGRRPPVRVTVAGHTYRSTVAVMGGSFVVPLSAENRSRAGVGAGDDVDVRLELDTQPREVTVPDDLAAALDAEPAARACFDGLSASRRRGYVLAVEGAKTAATRERRITKAVAELLGVLAAV